MISVDRLINDLTALNIDRQEVRVWLQVDVDGVSHRLPLGSMQFGVGGLSLALVGEPLPTPDPVIAPVPGVYSETQGQKHEHLWQRDEAREIWWCQRGDCLATVTYEQLLHEPIPADEAEGLLLLNRLAEPRPATVE